MASFSDFRYQLSVLTTSIAKEKQLREELEQAHLDTRKIHEKLDAIWLEAKAAGEELPDEMYVQVNFEYYKVLRTSSLIGTTFQLTKIQVL